jgi:hypothetical protein
MKTLNIWEVRAESGRKEPFLDVAANVVAEDFLIARSTLQELIKERIAEHPEIYVDPDGYKVTCVRIIQQVRTL